ncbi:GNAT family N-acetyltransferase [Microbulbifer sp. CAU 1566]|uniref:GNAT family N-acetyltransferase n=1 Tax=unclassified Microbulbifer TaxID=2619833 RepID=UPI001357518F|nr:MULTISPECIES: GNAT family N-acetyltransferase [unclassified Microbulbifer]MCK7598294.1 GNAT family N-acetyltransferase [Microbulbifer sp. CAU 1566]
MYLLTTERLQLRELTDSDEDARFTLALVNDPDFHRYIGDRGVRTVEQARHYLVQGPITMYRQHGLGMYRVELKDGTPVGQCGLLRRQGLDDVDIGFAFFPEYRGKGYALEAASAVMAWGKQQLGLRRIVAIASPDNRASIQLLENLGLTREGNITLPGDDEELLLMGWTQAK